MGGAWHRPAEVPAHRPAAKPVDADISPATSRWRRGEHWVPPLTRAIRSADIEAMSDGFSALWQRVRIHAALGDPVRLTIVDMLSLGDVSPGEIAREPGLATNLVAHHVNVLVRAGELRRAPTRHVADVVGDGDLVVAVCDRAYESLTGPQRPRLHRSVPGPAAADADASFEAAFSELTGRIERLVPAVHRAKGR